MHSTSRRSGSASSAGKVSATSALHLAPRRQAAGRVTWSTARRTAAIHHVPPVAQHGLVATGREYSTTSGSGGAKCITRKIINWRSRASLDLYWSIAPFLPVPLLLRLLLPPSSSSSSSSSSPSSSSSSSNSRLKQNRFSKSSSPSSSSSSSASPSYVVTMVIVKFQIQTEPFFKIRVLGLQQTDQEEQGLAAELECSPSGTRASPRSCTGTDLYGSFSLSGSCSNKKSMGSRRS